MQPKRQRNLAKINERRRDLAKERKIALIHRLGGSCTSCGLKYDGRNGSVFSLHHRDGATKEFSMGGNLAKKPWESLLSEAEKCDLLCAMCHTIHHVGEY